MIRSICIVFTLVMSGVWALSAHAEIEVQEITTPMGLTAWLVEEPSIPFVALELRFRGGTSLDRVGKRGEVNLMVGLLEEGAGPLDSQGFSQARDALATSLEFDAGLDTVAISARFLTENTDASMALLKSAMMDTRFEEEAIARVKGQVQSILRSSQTDPRDIAGDTLFARAFGAHPYGTDDNGTESSVAALTREDMFAARDRVLTQERLYISAVGDISAPELAALLDNLLGDLPKTGPQPPLRVEPALNGGTHVVDFATPQSVVIFGHRGITRDDPRYIPAYIATEILAGGRDGRLMQEVREKRGLTYGIGAHLSPFDRSELILGQFSTANATVGEAIEVVQNEWEKIAREGVTQEELDLAKTYLTGAYPLRFDGNGPIAGILVGMQMVGLGTDYISKRNGLVEAVTLDEINRVAREIYHPEALSFVVVGQPEGLDAN